MDDKLARAAAATVIAEVRASYPGALTGRVFRATLAEAIARQFEVYAEKRIRAFYEEVCRRAEVTMERGHKLEGAHYAAMQQLLKEQSREEGQR